MTTLWISLAAAGSFVTGGYLGLLIGYEHGLLIGLGRRRRNVKADLARMLRDALASVKETDK